MNKPEAICVTIPAAYKHLCIIGTHVQSLLRDIAEMKGTQEEEILALSFDIELAVHEICNNIIEHAYRHENGKIVIHFSYAQATNCINIILHDTGQPFDEAEVSPPDLNAPQIGGYGLFLIHQLLDEVTYFSSTDGNQWHLTKFLRDAKP